MARKKPDVRKHVCSFCGNESPQKLIAGPEIMICDECVARSVEIAREGNSFLPSTAGPTQIAGSQGFFSRLFLGEKPARNRQPTCEFCGKAALDLVQPPSTVGTRALICGQCRQLCQDIIAEERAHESAGKKDYQDEPWRPVR
jgi:ATP-dependent protease Clp ATPase subunit